MENNDKHNPKNQQVAYCWQLEDDLKVLKTLAFNPSGQKEGIIRQINLIHLHLKQLEYSINT
jgi:hypothetical protein